MKAVVLARPEAGAFEIDTDHAAPRPGLGEVLIKVKATSLCGTDKHIYDWDESIRDMIAPPLVPGHEFCGEVAELGPGVPARIAVGDYVSAEMHVVCGTCRQCLTGNGHICNQTKIYGIHRDGAFADLVVVPASNIIHLDRQRIPLRIGAFLDALGNAVHTCFKVPLSGKSVAILGYGPIGAMCAAVAQFCGASRIVITDVNPHALERARTWAGQVRRKGGSAAIDIFSVTREDREQSLWQIAKDGGTDVVLEISGAPPAINDGLKMARNGGDVVLLGLPRSKGVTLDNYKGDLIFRGLTLHGIIGRKMYETWFTMLGLLHAGLDIEHVVSHQLPLVEIEQGITAFGEGKAQKVVLYPDPADVPC